MLNLVTSLILLAPSALPEAPPPRPAKPTITDLSDCTITLHEGTACRWEGVMTPRGPRIRLNIKGVTIEATRLRFHAPGLPEGMMLEVSLNEACDTILTPIGPGEPLPMAAPKPTKP